MCARLHPPSRWRLARPLALLAVLAVLSLAARVAWLGAPCRSPCRSATDHVLIFDESYYVNAARVIAGVRPATGLPYANAPLGDDPNAEHPQLAKLIMAGSIELFGDGPFAWRLGSVVLGTLSILGLFALVRAAGGGPWLALGAAALMASDNLLLVHGRIATLDVYALAAMIWAAALYLRGRPLVAGVLIGVGACAKEVTPYVLLTLGLLEALRWLGSRRGFRAGAGRLGTCAAAAAGSFIALLAVLDRVAPPYADSDGKLVTGGPFSHIAHILSYASQQSSPHGPTGIASYPWQWLFDYKPITYLNINPARPTAGLLHVHPMVHFLGMISPPILLAGLPGVVLAVIGARRGARASSEVGVLSVAWFVGTFVPFELLSLLWSRTSYLYYMVVVMPGLYIAAAYLIARFASARRLVLAWVAAVALAAIIMYPLTPLPV